MRRRNWYTGQLVTEGQMDTAFEDVEQSIWRSSSDQGFYGVLDGHAVAPDSPESMSVVISGGLSYTPDGKRCFNIGDTTVDCSVDVDNITTTVVGVNKTKIISVFAVFDRALLSPEYDVTNTVVYTIEEESMSFEVIQGSEVTSPAPPIPPDLRSDGVLLADITFIYGQTQIVSADISVERREDFAVIVRKNGDRLPFAKYIEAIQAVLDLYEDHVDGTSDQHNAGDVLITGISSVQWANNDDWLPVVPISIKDALETNVVSKLATTGATSGAHRIGVYTSTYQSGTIPTLSAGTLFARLDDMRNGANIYVASMASWPDGTPAVNGAASVYDAINTNVITRLGARASAADQGCRRIGVYATGFGLASWQALTTTTVYGAFVALNSATGTDGAAYIGAKATGALSAGTVRTQLDALDTAKAALAGATFTGDIQVPRVGTGFIDLGVMSGNVSIADSIGSVRLKPQVPIDTFYNIALPTPASGNPIIIVRMYLTLPAGSAVFFVAPVDLTNTNFPVGPTDYYGKWVTASSSGTYIFQWNGSKWEIMLAVGGADPTGGGAYA